MINVGELMLFVLIAVLPCLLIYALAKIATRGSASKARGGKVTVGYLLAALAGLVLGAALLWSEASALAIGVSACVAISVPILLMMLLGAHEAVTYAATFILGAHAAVLVQAILDSGGSDPQDGQSVFRLMPVLDFWLFLGVPAVLAAIIVTSLRARRRTVDKVPAT